MGIFKKRNEYFYESFVELSTLSLNTYECLVKGIKEFNHENILELKNSVHELEHQADLKKREIEEKLAKVQSRQAEYEGRQIVFTPNAFVDEKIDIVSLSSNGTSVGAIPVIS